MMAKLYWRVKRNGKWTWRPVAIDSPFEKSIVERWKIQAHKNTRTQRTRPLQAASMSKERWPKNGRRQSTRKSRPVCEITCLGPHNSKIICGVVGQRSRGLGLCGKG